MSVYNAAAAIAMVRARTNENALPPDAIIQAFLNDGISDVSRRLGGLRLNATITTTPGNNTFTLGSDILDVISMSYSTLAPSTSGTIVYPLDQMELRAFMDFSGGVPGTGFGPPLAWTIVSDSSGQQAIQLYPPATLGQLNIYYRARGTPYSDALTSQTNLDDEMQSAMILYACGWVCYARERTVIGDQFFKMYDAVMEDLEEDVARRTTPKSGRVRDVLSMGRPGIPGWI